jgi:hypothetical protein
VFFLIGNYEAYESNYLSAKLKFQAFAQDASESQMSIGKFIFLDQTRFDLSPSVTILGCTLFSAISVLQSSSVRMFVCDFKRVQDWTVEDHNAAIPLISPG